MGSSRIGDSVPSTQNTRSDTARDTRPVTADFSISSNPMSKSTAAVKIKYLIYLISLSIEWNMVRPGGLAHGIVTVHKLSQRLWGEGVDRG